VELANPKWIFPKGLCIKTWLYPENCRSKKESILWMLKTDDKKEFELKLVSEELFFTYSKSINLSDSDGKPQEMLPVGSLLFN
jgi:hypothetical protein